MEELQFLVLKTVTIWNSTLYVERVVTVLSLKGKYNEFSFNSCWVLVVTALSLKGKYNICWEILYYDIVVTALSLKGKYNSFILHVLAQTVVTALSLKSKYNIIEGVSFHLNVETAPKVIAQSYELLITVTLCSYQRSRNYVEYNRFRKTSISI